jgi:hypothetical protein
MTQAHSLYGVGDLMLCVDGGDLLRIGADLNPITVRTGLGNARLSYAQVNDWVYYTNGSVSGAINAYDPILTKDTWGVPQPGGAPNITTTSGNLTPGLYQVTVTFVDALEESGAPAPASVRLDASGAIVLTDIPQSSASHVRIYCTEPNDSRLYRQVTLPMGTTTHTITQVVRGRELATLFLDPMPKGEIVRAHKGRLWVASGNLVSYSEPLYFGLYQPDNNYLPPFPAKVTMLEPVDDGLFISADKTYFLRGSTPDEFAITEVDPSRAIPGSSLQVRAQLITREAQGYAAYWYDADGPVLGLTGGTISHLTLDSLAGVVSSAGASGILRDEGMDRIVTSLFDAGDRTTFGASDSATIEIIRSNL